jgi:hypothetical protein
MFLKVILINICFLGALLSPPEKVFYQSNALKDIRFKTLDGEYAIQDDKNEKAGVQALEDEAGILYWYRRVHTEVCLTGECRSIDVGIYWDCTGGFMGLEVYKEPLTKTDHSNFFPADYDKLISILSNDWSPLREFEFTELLDDNSKGVDGVSGATKTEIASEAVRDAVYTTYTLWHLIHVGEKEQLAALTQDFLNKTSLIDKLVGSNEKKYHYFLLESANQDKLTRTPQIKSLIIKGLLTKDDPQFKDLSIRSLTKSILDDTLFQNELGDIYASMPVDEKVEFLSSVKSFNLSDKNLYAALEKDLDPQKEWLAVKILAVLKNSSEQSENVVRYAQKLSESNNEFIKNSASAFLQNK